MTLKVSLAIDLLASSFWSLKCCVSWADSIILSSEDPEYWVLELSSCSSEEEATKVLRSELERKGYSDKLNHKSICLGLMYENWKRNNISLKKLLTNAWLMTESGDDTADIANESISEMYDLAELSGFQITQELFDRLDGLFDHCHKLAKFALCEIQKSE